MLLLAWSWACSLSSVDRNPAEAPPPDVPSLDSDLPVEVPDPTPQLMLGLASGAVPYRQVLDNKRGFVLVEVAEDRPDDPRADATGRVRVARRMCGRRADRTLARLQEDLAARSEGGTRDVFRCDGPVCVHPDGGAGDWSGSYAFQAPEGRQVLGVVVRMGAPPNDPRRQQALEAWVDDEIRRLVSVSCQRPKDKSSGTSGQGS